jgi:uncharacterized protein YeeX (DUF496 family)
MSMQRGIDFYIRKDMTTDEAAALIRKIEDFLETVADDYTYACGYLDDTIADAMDAKR